MQRFVTNDLERLLVEALVADDSARLDRISALYSGLSDGAVAKVAKANDCSSIVARRLMDALGEDAVAPHWRAAWEATHGRIRRYLGELDAVAAALAVEGIGLVALKNGGIARGIYPYPGECPMGDLDVLVERDRFRDAHRILSELGYELDFRVADTIEKKGVEEGLKSGGTEYRKKLDDDETLWFELQWRPVAGRWIRPDAEPDARTLMARSLPIEGTDVRLLAPVDNLMQVCLHTAKHTYVRAPGLRLHTDVDRIVRGQAVDWPRFLAWVETIEVKTAVYFSLAIPHALFGTPVPDMVLTHLQPALPKRELMLRMLRKAGLFDASAHKFTKAAFIAFTMLMYDDVPTLTRGVFPDWSHMQQQYDLTARWQLPVAHGRRIFDLAFRRAKKL